MNILIVKAHPSSCGLTHGIVAAYQEEKEKLGDTLRIMDLYSQEYALPFYSFENLHDRQETDVEKKMKEQITWAEEIVFVHPVWWGSLPAILKNFLDHILAPRFAFRYDENKNLIKLLVGKKAKIFATAGGMGWIYKIPGIMPLRAQWTTPTLDFCGIELLELSICAKMDIIRDPILKENLIKEFLEKVRKSARNVG